MVAKCDTCEKIIDRQDSWMKGEKHFCNKECHIKFQTTLKGEQTNNWRGGSYKFICKFCSKPCERRRNPVKPKYCSLKCVNKDKATASQGKDHWNWKGRMDTRYMRKSAPRPMPDKCEICGALGINFKKGLCYDHNHKTKKFRGWLCSNCNTVIGLSKENTSTLKSIIKYIQKNQ